MTLDGSNKHTDATPTLQMDRATFQAAATITVTAAMTQLNTTNTNGNKNSAKNSNGGDSQGHQRVCSYKDSPNPEPKVSHKKKWEYYSRKESCKPREGLSDSRTSQKTTNNGSPYHYHPYCHNVDEDLCWKFSKMRQVQLASPWSLSGDALQELQQK